MQQEGAMEQEKASAAALGITGKLEAAKGEVGLASPFDGRLNEPGQGVAVSLQDELIGGGNAVARPGFVDAQDQGVVEDARSLEHGPAPGAAAQDGDAEFPADGQVDLRGGFVGVTDHDEVLRRSPEAQEFLAAAGFAEVEQRLVTGEVLLGRRQYEVAEFHVLYYCADTGPTVLSSTARLAAIDARAAAG